VTRGCHSYVTVCVHACCHAQSPALLEALIALARTEHALGRVPEALDLLDYALEVRSRRLRIVASSQSFTHALLLSPVLVSPSCSRRSSSRQMHPDSTRALQLRSMVSASAGEGLQRSDVWVACSSVAAMRVRRLHAGHFEFCIEDAEYLLEVNEKADMGVLMLGMCRHALGDLDGAVYRFGAWSRAGRQSLHHRACCWKSCCCCVSSRQLQGVAEVQPRPQGVLHARDGRHPFVRVLQLCFYVDFRLHVPCVCDAARACSCLHSKLLDAPFRKQSFDSVVDDALKKVRTFCCGIHFCISHTPAHERTHMPTCVSVRRPLQACGASGPKFTAPKSYKSRSTTSSLNRVAVLSGTEVNGTLRVLVMAADALGPALQERPVQQLMLLSLLALLHWSAPQ
jgi:hypothetical protein